MLNQQIQHVFSLIPSEKKKIRIKGNTIQESIEKIPEQYELKNNFPNPFNQSTTIQYSIPEDQHVELTVYNVLGKVVQTLQDEYQEKGTYRVTFDAEKIPSGLYFYQLKAGSFSQSKKMLCNK